MFLIRGDRITEDGWTTVADHEALPADHPALVSLARWQTERGALLTRGQPLGVRLTGAHGPEGSAGDRGGPASWPSRRPSVMSVAVGGLLRGSSASGASCL